MKIVRLAERLFCAAMLLCFAFTTASAQRTITPVRSNPDALFVNESTSLTITVAISPDPALKKKKVKLCRVNQNGEVLEQLGRLNDNGGKGDAIANDNIYSGQFVFQEPAPGEVWLAVIAKYTESPGKIASPVFALKVFKRQTETEINSINQVQQEAQRVFDSTRQQSGDVAARDAVLSYLRRQSNVADTGIAPDGKTIWISYQTGVEGLIHTNRSAFSGQSASTPAPNSRDRVVPNPPSLSSNNPALPSNTIQVDNKNKAIVIAPFFDLFSPYDSSAEIANMLSRACDGNVTLIQNQQATIGVMRNLYQYGVIYISTHGGMIRNGEVGILTREVATTSSERLYELDWLAHRLFITGAEGDSTNTQYLGVTPEFVRYYNRGGFPNSLVYIDACDSLGIDNQINSTLASAFLENGADTYLGWNKSVNSGFAAPTARRIFGILTNELLPPQLRTAGVAFTSLDSWIDPIGDDHAQFFIQGNHNRTICDPENDFSIAAWPSPQQITQAGTASFTINTNTSSGGVQAIQLKATGLPSGTIYTFNPASLNSGTSSILTISTSAATPPGNYVLTITGQGTKTHSATAELIVSHDLRLTPLISSNPASGPNGTTFIIVGRGFTPNGTIQEHIRKPDMSEYPVNSYTADSGGRKTANWTSSDSTLPGTYTIWWVDATTGIRSNEVARVISDAGTLLPTLNISPMSGQQHAVTYTYSGSNYTPNGTVNRFITFPNGQTQQIDSITADGTGHITWQFSPTCTDPVGASIVWAVDAGTNRQSNTVSQTVTANPSCSGAPTLSINPSSIQQTTGTFTYSGTNYTANGTVNRFITFPSGQTQQISSITANSSGQVNWTFSPACADPVGTSTVWAVDVATSRQSNNVSQMVTAHPSCSAAPTLSISPPSGQQLNTTFTFSGGNYTPNGTVNRFITFPNGQTQQISAITANSSGQINWTFSPTCSDPVGTSTVWAVDVGTNRQSNNVSQVVTANASCSLAPTLSISPTSGQQLTTTFNYSGSNYTPNGTVNRFITFPNGQTQQISSITANASGQIGWTFAPACSDPVGTSTVWAVDVGTNRQSNNVSQPVTANPSCSPVPTLSISPSSGQQTVVTFTYSGSSYTPNGTINRFITFPNGQTQQISSITANASGQINWTFSPTCADPVGTSTVWAVDVTTNRQSNSVTQTVTANPACSQVTLNSSPASVQQANGTFTVTGSNYTPNGTVRRFIIPPGGAQQEISSTTANASGQVNWTFSPSCTDPVGTTTLWAVDAATNRQSNTVTQTVTANSICSPPTLNSSPASVQQANGTFTVTGSNYTPNGTVRRFIIPPGGSQQEISSTTANASGQVNWTFSPSCTDPVGTTTLWAIDASTNRQSNNVTQTVTANPTCSPAPTLNSSPASVQQANGTFIVTGSNYTPNGTVRRFIIPPGGSQQEISSTTANASGQVNWTFAPSCNDPVGTTTLWAVDAATNRQSNNVTQTVTANSICSAPTLSSSPASVQQANGTFTITGSNYTPNGTVRRFIIPPGGAQQEISSTTANGSGQVNWTFAPSCNDPVGTTTLWAVDAATNRQSNNVTQTVTANSICNPPTLSSSPPSVQQANGAFNVSGSNYTPNGTVRRFIIPPGGSQQEISSTTANGSGQVNWTFAPSCSDPVGTTTLWAVDAATNRQSNNVTQTVTANPSCSPPPTLSISPSSGQQTVVTFTYNGSNYTPNGTVNRFITFPNGQTQQISSITANASGQINWTFSPTCADPVGTSTVWAVDVGTNRQSNNVSQAVTAHPSCSPAPTLNISPSSGQQTVVTFIYTGSNYTPNGTVNRFITFPNGQTQQISSITASSSGQVSWTFHPTCADPVGTSTVWAVDVGTNRQSNNVGQTVTHHPSCP